MGFWRAETGCRAWHFRVSGLALRPLWRRILASKIRGQNVDFRLRRKNCSFLCRPVLDRFAPSAVSTVLFCIARYCHHFLHFLVQACVAGRRVVYRSAVIIVLDKRKPRKSTKWHETLFASMCFCGGPNVYFSPLGQIVVRTTFNSTNLKKMPVLAGENGFLAG